MDEGDGAVTRFRLTRRNALGGGIAAVGSAILAWPPVTFAQSLLAIAVPEFTSTPDERATARMMWETVTRDLVESGRIALVDPARFAGFAVSQDKPPDFDAWRNTGAAALITGRVMRRPDGALTFAFRLWDLAQKVHLAGYQYDARLEEGRRVAHVAAETLYERLTGERRVFDPR